jgi:hypothetical protein
MSEGTINGNKKSGRYGRIVVNTDGSVTLYNVVFENIVVRNCDLIAESGEYPIPFADRMNMLEDWASQKDGKEPFHVGGQGDEEVRLTKREWLQKRDLITPPEELKEFSQRLGFLYELERAAQDHFLACSECYLDLEDGPEHPSADPCEKYFELIRQGRTRNGLGTIGVWPDGRFTHETPEQVRERRSRPLLEGEL